MKGKWCYEVFTIIKRAFPNWFLSIKKLHLLSNMGVGDDKHSFGYDGYRLSCWHEKEK